jgi:DHA1 family bicyclomycin/chloramphenicol resistance-like MFS transporter
MQDEKAFRPCGMHLIEFVIFLGFGTALNAFAIDVMLPALPVMSEAFALRDPASVQATIAACLLGMGISQLAYGPLADRYGRKPVLLGGLILFVFAGVFACFTENFTVLLVARFFQGVGAGAPRVMAASMARDCYSGNQLGRVMSLITIVWVSTPAIAPFVGQFMLLFTTWRWLFVMLVVTGILMVIWTQFRMQESLKEEYRRAIAPKAIWGSYVAVLSTRSSLFYLLALAMLFGPHLGFIISSPHIFIDVFGAKERFALFFALTCIPMGLAALINAKLVMVLGLRRMVAIGLTALVLQNIVHVLIGWSGAESLAMFIVVQMANMFVFGFVASTLNALVMQPLGHVAGTASSFVGFFSLVSGAFFGSLIGRIIDDSILPLAIIYTLMGAGSLTLATLATRWARAHELTTHPNS